MAHWFQRVLLGASLATFTLVTATEAQAEQVTTIDSIEQLDNELFELGVTTGIINIQDFGSEFVTGINAGFIASEDIFMQLNYVFADAGLSSFEKSQGALFSGDDRKFQHFDFLVGYNLYQGEQFFSGTDAQLSSLYLVAGIGDTDFGGEESFTYTVGIGYQIGLSRTYNLKFDYRDYIYDSSLLLEDESTHNAQFSVSLNVLF
ncbi:outer membrane beta-barrel domain-containing protein [Aliikangiella coralliicola]|uniref:Outer membrane beta-barrel domain-containing protein n=1 Tax=Aliikangiella coralliicola TaxID=2592383 RepID=A0A545U008_9GAMM|nr:outer membrane beta-barrel domain-containing protein [Aliikangiella coralliicola]TQV82802.1 outer membrane beta-barrel domain-containing protein [Aliikangiella coralliicola]